MPCYCADMMAVHVNLKVRIIICCLLFLLLEFSYDNGKAPQTESVLAQYI